MIWGMDPRRRAPAAAPAGLPRTRGDGPMDEMRSSIRRMAPPHTRGWTLEFVHSHVRSAGSPAHAGMDRTKPGDGRGNWWLPRTRGDGPYREAAIFEFPVAPPHTRGWTTRPGLASCRPAWLPRTRGDGPPNCPSTVTLNSAPPHTRGWTRGIVDQCEFDLGLPRTRGDGPSGGRSGPFVWLAPPHTRGWTRQRVERNNAEAGSPAHAGMDPLEGNVTRR